MSNIISDQGLGIFNAQQGGAHGTTSIVGQGGDQIYVNAATGNLILQRKDENLIGLGKNTAILRTYNSQGDISGVYGANWKLGLRQSLEDLPESPNSVASTVVKVNADGHRSVFYFLDGVYTSTDGAGAHDTLTYQNDSWSWVDGNTGAKEIYDTNGVLLSTQDSDGNETTYHYTAGQLVRVVDGSGQQTHLEYHPANQRLKQVRTVQLNGSQAVVESTTVRYEYDELNRLSSVVIDLSPEDGVIDDAHVYRTVYGYDTENRLTVISQSDGQLARFGYEGLGAESRIKTITDGEGRVTKFSYRDDVRITDVESHAGHVNSYEYDEQKRLLRTISPAINGQRLVTTYRYDEDDNVIEIEDAKGNKVWRSFENGNLTHQVDSEGNSAAWYYNSDNQLISETVFWLRDNDGLGATEPLDAKTQFYTYDSEGHVRFEVSAAGRITENLYTVEGLRKQTLTYLTLNYPLSGLEQSDELLTEDIVAWLALKTADEKIVQRTHYQYDFRGQLSHTTSYADTAYMNFDTRAAHTTTTQFIYDENGRLITQIDADQQATHFAYDGLGRIIRSEDAAKAIALTHYDDANQSIITQTASGLVTTQVYDRSGLLINTLQTPDGVAGEVIYQYDASGLLASTIDADGARRFILRDELGREIASIDTLGALTEYTLDSKGKVVQQIAYEGYLDTALLVAADESLNTTALNIDELRLQVDDANKRLTYFVYDASDRLVFSLNHSGFVTETRYDTAGRVIGTVEYETPVVMTPDIYPTKEDIEASLDSHASVMTVHNDVGVEVTAPKQPYPWFQEAELQSSRVQRRLVNGGLEGSLAIPQDLVQPFPYLSNAVKYSNEIRQFSVPVQQYGNVESLFTLDEVAQYTPYYEAQSSLTLSNQQTAYGQKLLWEGDSWQQDFSAAGLGFQGDDRVYEQRGATLVLKNSPDTTTSFKRLMGQRQYEGQQDFSFRAEFTTNAEATGYFGFGISSGVGDALQEHGVILANNLLVSHSKSNGQSGTYELATLLGDANYVIEIEKTVSGSTLYVYLSGQAKNSGLVHNVDIVGWGNIETYIDSAVTNHAESGDELVVSRISEQGLRSDLTTNVLYRETSSAGDYQAALVTVEEGRYVSRLYGVDNDSHYEVILQQADAEGEVHTYGNLELDNLDADTVSMALTQRDSDVTFDVSGASLQGYFSGEQARQYRYVEAVVYDATGVIEVSRAVTVPSAIIGYDGSLNISMDGPLEEGSYQIHVKGYGYDGHIDSLPVLSYQVGTSIDTQTFSWPVGVEDPSRTLFTYFNYADGIDITVAATVVDGYYLAEIPHLAMYSNLAVNIQTYDDYGKSLDTVRFSAQAREGYQREITASASSYYKQEVPVTGSSIDLSTEIPAEEYEQIDYISTKVTRANDGGYIATTRTYPGAMGDTPYEGQVNLTTDGFLAGDAYFIEPTIHYKNDNTRSLDTIYYELGDANPPVNQTLTWSRAEFSFEEGHHRFEYRAANTDDEWTTVDPAPFVEGDFFRVDITGLSRGTPYLGRITHQAGEPMANDVYQHQVIGQLSFAAEPGHVALQMYFDQQVTTSNTVEGTSVSGVFSTEEAANIDYIYVDVHHESDNRFISRSYTYPRAYADYQGELNLSTDALLVDGSYQVNVTAVMLDGTLNTSKSFVYQVGEQVREYDRTLLRIAVTDGPDNTQLFYQLWQLSDDFYPASLSSDGQYFEIEYHDIPRGLYDLKLEYRDTEYQSVQLTADSRFIADGQRSRQEIIRTGLAEALPGRYTQNFYTDDGLLAATLDAGGFLTAFIYDGAERLIETHRYATATGYSGLRNNESLAALKQRVGESPHDIREYHLYDGRGLKVATIDGEGYLTEYRYDSRGLNTDILRYSRTVAYQQQPLSELRNLATDPLQTNQIQVFTYDEARRLKTSIDVYGTLTRFEYDLSGNLIREIRGENDVHDEARQSYQRFDELGRVIAELNAEASALLATATTDEAKETVWQHHSTTHYYDHLGNLIRSRGPVHSVMDQTTWTEADSAATTYFFYDSEGRVNYTVNAQGGVTETQYNAFGQVESLRVYQLAIDTVGLVGGTDHSLLHARLTQSNDDTRTSFSYNQIGTLANRVEGDSASSLYIYNSYGEVNFELETLNTAENKWRINQRIYDNRGLQIELRENVYGVDQVTNAMNYDAFGRLVHRTDGNGNHAHFAYDRRGQQILSGQSGVYQRTVYDAFGRIYEQYQPAELAFDTQGNIVKSTDREGLSTFYAYNANNQRIFTIDPSGLVSETRYDPEGRLSDEISYSKTVESQLTVWLLDNPEKVAPSASDISEFFAKLHQASGEYDRQLLANGAANYDRDSQQWGGDWRAIEESGDYRLGYAFAEGENQAPALNQTIDLSGFDHELIDSGKLNITLAGEHLATDMITHRWLVAFIDGAEPPATIQPPLAQDFFNNSQWMSENFELSIPPGTRSVDISLTSLSLAEDRGTTTPEGTATYFDNLRVSVNDDTGGVYLSAPDISSHQHFSYDSVGVRHTEILVAGTSYDSDIDSTQYRYDDSQRGITVSTPEGITTHRFSNQHGEVMRIVDGEGNRTDYHYDRNGQQKQVEVFNADGVSQGVQQASEFDVSGRKIASFTASGTKVSYQYDSLGQVLAVTNDDGGLSLVTRYRYDAKGQQVDVINADGTLIRTEYDSHGRVSLLIEDASLDGLQRTTRYEYDEAGNILRKEQGDINNLSQQVVSYQYDRLNRLISETIDPDNYAHTTHYWYDKNNNRIGTEDANHHVTLFVYDEFDRMRYQVNHDGELRAFDYDLAGNTIREHFHALRISTQGLESELDATRQSDKDTVIHTRIKALSPSDQITHSVYDDSQRLIFSLSGERILRQYHYDANNRVVAEVEFKEALPSAIEINREALSNYVGMVVFPEKIETRTVYDALGRAVFTLDALGYVSQNTFDSSGNVIKTTRFANRVMVVGYDLNPEDISPAVNSAQDQHFYSFYDALNRLTHSVNAEGYVVKNTHDSLGNIIQTTVYAEAVSVDETTSPEILDSILSSQELSRARTTRFIYNSLSQQRFAIDPAGYVTEMEYDKLGRIVNKIVWANPVGDEVYSETSMEETLGSLQTLVDQRISTFYGTDGRIKQVRDANNNSEYYAYDGVGNRTQFTNKHSSVWTYLYDAQGRLTHEFSPEINVTTLTSSGTTTTTSRVIETENTYDGVGNLLTRTEAKGLEEQRTTHYEYDGHGQQIGTRYQATELYNAHYEREDTRAVITTSVIYNDRGQAVVNQVTTDQAVPEGDEILSTSYKAYDALGRVAFEVDAEDYVTAYIYDAFGNIFIQVRFAEKLDFSGHERGQEWTEQEIVAALVNSQDHRLIINTYDRLNQLTQSVMNEIALYDNGEVFQAAPTSKKTYNAFSEVVKLSQLRDPSQGEEAWVNSYFYFDNRGYQIGTIDANGYVTAHSYNDAKGNLLSTIEYARQLTIAVDENTDFGTILSHVPKTGLTANNPKGADREIHNTYDVMQNLKSVSQIGVAYSKSHTDDVSRVTHHTGNRTTHFYYDALGNKVKQKDASGNILLWYYDKLGRTTAIVEPARILDSDNSQRIRTMTSFKHDALGNVIKQTRHGAGVSDAVSDTVAPSVVGHQDDQISYRRYNDFGHKIADSAEYEHLWRYWDGNIAREINTMTNSINGVASKTVESIYRYDRLGREIEKAIRYDDGGSAFQRNQVRYNAYGEVDAKGKNGTFFEFYHHDKAGNIIRSNDGNGVGKLYAYNALGQGTGQFSSWSKDLNNSEYTLSDVVADLNNGVQYTLMSRDNLGRVIRETTTAFSDGMGGSITPVVERDYDRWGNVLQINNARSLSNKSYYRYNHLDQVVIEFTNDIAVTNEQGVTALQTVSKQYSYDAAGRLLQERDANGHTQTKTYNVAGEVLLAVNGEGDITHSSYDVLGREVRTVSATGKIQEKTYDDKNRVLSETRGKETTTYTYDVLGNRISVTNANNEKTRYVYNQRGDLTAVLTPKYALDPDQNRTFYDYDAYGNKVYEEDGNARTRFWLYSNDTERYFQRASQYRDLGSALTTYTYDSIHRQLGNEINERGVNKHYDYFKNGLLEKITDAGVRAGETIPIGYWTGDSDNGVTSASISWDAINSVTEYRYDAAGNRTFEYFSQNGTVHQNAFLSYDKQDRLSRYADQRATIDYHYDAVGNRRSVSASYLNSDNASQGEHHWYRYDKANRMTVSQGELLASAGGMIAATEEQGVELSYWGDDNRQSARFYDTEKKRFITEKYTFNAENKLHETYRDYKFVLDSYDLATGNFESHFEDLLQTSRTYDEAGRQSDFWQYDDQGVLDEHRVTGYNSNGQRLYQRAYDGTGEGVSETRFHLNGNENHDFYDGAGNLLAYELEVYDSYTNAIGYDYLIFDGYAEERVIGDSDYFLSGNTNSTYDINGNRLEIDDQKSSEKDRSFIVNGEGQILRKTQEGKNLYYFFANGNTVGHAGHTGTEEVVDFDYNYRAISDQYPSSTPSSHIINKGDTLQSIAAQVYGDASLWYFIAEANGLNAEETLQEGMAITIPNRIDNIHNTAETFQPYNPSEVVGDTTPTMPDPPPPSSGGGCGTIGTIIMVVVAVVVAIYAPVLLGHLTTAFGGGLAGFAAAVVVTGVAVTAVNQAAAIAVGAQDGFSFSWREVIANGVAAAFVAPSLDGLNALEAAAAVAVHAAQRQAINMAIGVQEKFDWKSVAVSAVSAGINTQLGASGFGSVENKLNTGNFDLGTQLRSAAVSQVARIAVNGGGKFEWRQVAADGFGNALGNHIGNATVDSFESGLNNLFGSDVKPAAPLTLWQPKAEDFDRLGSFFRRGNTGDSKFVTSGQALFGRNTGLDKRVQQLSDQTGLFEGSVYGNMPTDVAAVDEAAVADDLDLRLNYSLDAGYGAFDVNFSEPDAVLALMGTRAPETRATSWGDEALDSFLAAGSAQLKGIATEQNGLYDNTNGFGSVMQWMFKPLVLGGTLMGHSIGWLGGDPNSTKYWNGLGESVNSAINLVGDAFSGDPKAFGLAALYGLEAMAGAVIGGGGLKVFPVPNPDTQTIATSLSGNAKALAPISTLNKRQVSLLDSLSSSNSMAPFRKRDVSMSDLQALTKVTGDEFSMYTLGARRTIIRGKGESVTVNQEVYDSLIAGEYGKWSGHTHRAGYSINPGPADRPMLIKLDQKQSAIWPANADTKPNLFGQIGPDNDLQLQSDVTRKLWESLYGQ